MTRILELFGTPTSISQPNREWRTLVERQQCPYVRGKCFKVRKSEPEISIGTCSVLFGRNPRPIVICPARLLERRQIFIDSLHLLTSHEPGNELHVVPEVSVPGGHVDYFLVSTRGDTIVDFVGIEVQTLDTTGTVWPERQRLLKQLDIERGDDAEQSSKPFGMNWKMTAKTILVQMHHKSQTFEDVNRKLVLVMQDALLDYMRREFNFSHLRRSASVGDSVHLHSYALDTQSDHDVKIVLDNRLSTGAEGIARCLGLKAEARMEIEQIHQALKQRISEDTIFVPV